LKIPFFTSKITANTTSKDKVQRTVKSVGSILASILGRFNRQLYEAPESNLLIIRDCLLEESIFRRAVDKIQEQIWKNGWKITGKNPKTVKYIKKRLREIAEVSGISTQELLERISRQLIIYSNCFIIKVRKQTASSGIPRRTLSGKLLQPVAAYFPQSTLHVKIKRDDSGNIKKYLFADTESIMPDNALHIYLHKEEGFAFGTPMVVPVMDDIMALRQVEEHANILTYQHAIPLFHFMIGDEGDPGTAEEITQLNTQIEAMPAHGSLTTTNRVKIDVLGTKREGMDLGPILQYWKTRVLGGLGISGIGMGEADTANRGTAVYLDKEFQNTTAVFQRAIKHAFNFSIIKELLAEGGYKWLTMDEKDEVSLYIPEIDLAEKIKQETHVVYLYEHNSITEDEMRVLLGLDPIPDSEREKMITWLVKIPLALVVSGDETLADNPYSKDTDNKQKPTNQFGKKLAKTIPKND